MSKKFAVVFSVIAALVLVTFSLPGSPEADEKKDEIERLLDRGNELAQKGD